ncbi:hypothetical protein AYL99_11823 [Fonsecaea erecta]|uniref:Uncharacterized protein n=1 Tax=Fonsecaea erecta TaxID=1367422 RepID=A0A178Z418_9EURO|nr:hypothetical protein AYL99_11823 [Fonsecaea erecta]OAP53943.1 hypothetical protein AYL99_11823 [Fonsecaea erecta]
MATGESKPLVMTPFMCALSKMSTESAPIVFPGKYIVTAFVNRTLNTEDAYVVSKELAESGMFSWSGLIYYPLPKNVGYVRVGMVVKDQYWWAPAIEGTVLEVEISRSGDPIAVVYVASKVLRIGDKLGIMHGLKFTVGELLPYEVTVTSVVPEDEMPSIIDEKTGKEFKPNMLISTKNLARGLGGQVREMAAVTNIFDSIEAFRTKEMHRPRKAVVMSFEDQKRVTPRLPKGDVVVRGKRLTFTDTTKKLRTVRATYGIMRILQLRHIAALKHHYLSTVFRSITVPRGRYRMGTPRLSEGELLAIVMQNCTSVDRDRLRLPVPEAALDGEDS